MEKTFKEYLMEYGGVERGYVGDQQLQMQQTGREKEAQFQNQGKEDFANNLEKKPEVGHVIENKAGRFVVVGKTPEGITVKKLGEGPDRGRVINVPQITKYKFVGNTGQSNKPTWNIVK